MTAAAKLPAECESKDDVRFEIDRIDQALLEILSEDYHIDLAELKKKADGMKSPTG